MASPDTPRRLDVRLMAHPQDGAAHDARGAGGQQDAQDQGGAPQARAEDGHQADQQHQRRKRDPDVDQPLDE